MKPTIVFIVTSINNSHDKNRIEEFIDNDYPVRVYGFVRNGITTPLSNTRYTITPLGNIQDQRYKERLRVYERGIRQVVKETKLDNVLYYLPSLDVALMFRTLYPFKAYLYELCDLMQAEMKRPLLQRLLDIFDRYIIRHAKLSIITSEGFIQYHFGKRVPPSVVVVPNRLNPTILNYNALPKTTDINHLRIAFVGNARYKTITNVAKVVGTHFPQHEFHFYGTTNDEVLELEKQYSNIFTHGRFANPKDLPTIYSQVDLLICTYDTATDNVRFAEPNKLYEAIYFETPIVVSSRTFLSDKVHQLGIGYEVEAMSDEEVIRFIKNITLASLQSKQQCCQQIDKTECINLNPYMFQRLASICCAQ